MSEIFENQINAKSFHSSRLKGKVAIVTASTEGIGFAIAQRLGKEGASVVISSRKEANVKKATELLRKDGIEVEGVVCHVANEEQRKKMFQLARTKFGGIDILVSNAAVNPARPVSSTLETDVKVWDKIFEINLKCSWLLAKEVYPELLKRGGGSIVFISSLAGYHVIELDLLGPYGVSKTALIGLTKAIAQEVARENIRVNCVAPGLVATKFASSLSSSQTKKEKSLSIIPMKRFGKTHEIAGAVAYLVSEDAAYMTGETLVVAGGAHTRL